MLGLRTLVRSLSREIDQGDTEVLALIKLLELSQTA